MIRVTATMQDKAILVTMTGIMQADAVFDSATAMMVVSTAVMTAAEAVRLTGHSSGNSYARGDVSKDRGISSYGRGPHSSSNRNSGRCNGYGGNGYGGRGSGDSGGRGSYNRYDGRRDNNNRDNKWRGDKRRNDDRTPAYYPRNDHRNERSSRDARSAESHHQSQS